MKTIFLALALSIVSLAQPTISNQAIRVAATTPYSTLLEFDTSVTSGGARAVFDTVDPPTAGSTPRRSTLSVGTSLGVEISGLYPSTTYYVRGCATASSIEGCATSSVSFTTAAAQTPAVRFARPNEPAVTALPAMPASYTTTLDVDTSSNCSGVNGLQAKLNAAQTASCSNSNVLVRIPSGAICDAGTNAPYVMKSCSGGGGGWIVLTTDTSSLTLPPEDIGRMTNYFPVASLATLRGNGSSSTGVILNSSSGLNKFRVTGLRIQPSIPTSAYQTVTAVNAGTITITAHGSATNDLYQFFTLNADGTATPVVRNAKITVADANNFTISATSSGSASDITVGMKAVKVATMVNTLVNLSLSDNVTNFVFDRNYVDGNHFPLGINFGMRAQTLSNAWIVNNTFNRIVSWRNTDPSTGLAVNGDFSTPEAVDCSYFNGLTMENNAFVDSVGITVFCSEVDGQNQHSNGLFRRNYFVWSRAFSKLDAQWDKWDHVYRQHLEFKRCRTCKVSGNEFSTHFSGGQTGGTSHQLEITPRSKTSAGNGSTNTINNLIVENNLFHDGAGGMAIAGNSPDGFSGDVERTRNVLVRNNLLYNIDGRSGGQTTALGTAMYIRNLENAVVEHNTIGYTQHGTSPFPWYTYYQRFSGLRFRNNLISVNWTSPFSWTDDSNGNQMLPARVSSGTVYNQWINSTYFSVPSQADPDSDISYNLFVPGVISTSSPDYNTTGVTSATCSTNSGSNWALDSSSGNKCATGSTANNRFDYVKWQARTVQNFRLKYDSPGISGGLAGVRLTNDGLDIGVNNDELFAEMGKVVGGAYLVRSATPKVRYMPPDNQPCWTNPTNTYGSGAWASDGGDTIRQMRSTTVSTAGVSSVFLHCGTQLYSCNTSTGGACTLVF
jgi:hypothetical protein